MAPLLVDAARIALANPLRVTGLQPAGLTTLPNTSGIGWQGRTRTDIHLLNREAAYRWRTCQCGATGTIRTFIALAFNQKLYPLELPLPVSITALGRLPGPVSPHRYPDQTAVPLYSPSLRQAVLNNEATGLEPIQVLPHPLATSQVPQTWSRWHGIEPATSCLQGRCSSPLSYTGKIIGLMGFEPITCRLSGARGINPLLSR